MSNQLKDINITNYLVINVLIEKKNMNIKITDKTLKKKKKNREVNLYFLTVIFLFTTSLP